jgi:septal ring factor EnvC (AmiA/AmiB activator)
MAALTAPSGDSVALLVLDPRESMIEGIAENSEALLATFEKTLKVSQQHQAQQKQTIATIAKTNEELQAALIASEGRTKEIELLHQAEMKALQDRVKELSEENTALKQKAKAMPRLAAIITHYIESKKTEVPDFILNMAHEQSPASAEQYVVGCHRLLGISYAQAQQYVIGMNLEIEMQRALKETAEEFQRGEFK